MNSNNKPVAIFVDDEEDFLTVIRLQFRKEVREGKFDLLTFENGQKCLDYLKENYSNPKILLVLSDINMPVLDGIGLLKEIKSLYPSIEISMASAYDDEERKKRVASYGASNYFVKPIDFEIVRKIINDQIDKK